MSLNKLKNVVIGMAVVTATVGVVMESARAGIVKPSGPIINTGFVEFEYDSDTSDSDLRNDQGFFKDTIKNYNSSNAGRPVDSNLSGSITVSKLTLDNDKNVPNLSDRSGNKFTLERLENVLSGQRFAPNFSDLSNVIRYDVELKGAQATKTPQFVWFVNSRDTNLINNLSGLSQFKGFSGLYTNDFGSSGSFSFTIPEQTKIPEPSNIVGIIVVSAVIAVSQFNKLKPLKIS